MKYRDSDGVPLPKGIWYEAKRDRYRVRLYDGQQVRHLSYHRTLEEAEQTLANVKGCHVEELRPVHHPNRLRRLAIDLYARRHSCATD